MLSLAMVCSQSCERKGHTVPIVYFMLARESRQVRYKEQVKKQLNRAGFVRPFENRLAWLRSALPNRLTRGITIVSHRMLCSMRRLYLWMRMLAMVDVVLARKRSLNQTKMPRVGDCKVFEILLWHNDFVNRRIYYRHIGLAHPCFQEYSPHIPTAAHFVRNTLVKAKNPNQSLRYSTAVFWRPGEVGTRRLLITPVLIAKPTKSVGELDSKFQRRNRQTYIYYKR